MKGVLYGRRRRYVISPNRFGMTIRSGPYWSGTAEVLQKSNMRTTPSARVFGSSTDSREARPFAFCPAESHIGGLLLTNGTRRSEDSIFASMSMPKSRLSFWSPMLLSEMRRVHVMCRSANFLCSIQVEKTIRKSFRVSRNKSRSKACVTAWMPWRSTLA